ncbi:hypothetical protein CRG98_038977 [Punica granatum]|uniref:Uncharacterized protein n=1 Tax=Punica granatum TaxID=22663 RepID=A0A2I0I9G2_PUNGR|nr:hypothetical protein CRG98_038977 [Punica granatum]
MRDGTVRSRVRPLVRRVWAIFASTDPNGTDRLGWAVLQPDWQFLVRRSPQVAVVVVWFQSCRVDPYSPAKITKNIVRLGNRPDWAVFGFDVTTVAPDGILRQGQQLPTPN